jgi:hypothetical protein
VDDGDSDKFKIGTTAIGTNTALTIDGSQNATFSGAVTLNGGLNTPLVVAQGGTGVAALTANNLLLGAGTGNVTFAAPGTSGNVLTSNGTVWASAAAAGGGLDVLAKTGTYTVATGDGSNVVVLCTGTFTVTLYAASGNSGNVIQVKNVSTGTITIDANASETIDGATTQTITARYTSLSMVCDGTNWHII